MIYFQALSKMRSTLLESKPPTSKKLRIDETGPLPPGATVERFAANATKKLDSYNGMYILLKEKTISHI